MACELPTENLRWLRDLTPMPLVDVPLRTLHDAAQQEVGHFAPRRLLVG